MSYKSFPFSHSKLDVFHVALELAAQARRISDRVPRGYRSFADQLKRAAGSTVLLIGEGANRYSAGAKRQRYSEARGECGEVAAALQLLVALELVPKQEVEEALSLAGRIGAMLTRLIQRLG